MTGFYYFLWNSLLLKIKYRFFLIWELIFLFIADFLSSSSGPVAQWIEVLSLYGSR